LYQECTNWRKLRARITWKDMSVPSNRPGGSRSRCGRALLLAIVSFAAHLSPAGGIGPRIAAAQEEALSGRLGSVWEDPLPGRGEPRLRHFLSRSDGSTIALRITEAQLRAVGGSEAARGAYVEVRGSWRRGGREPGASSSTELDVGSIRFSVDPSGASPPPEGIPITGSHPWVTVLCRFSDYPSTEPHPLDWYEGLMGSAEPGADHYWRELSFDQANVAGSEAHGWYDLPQPRSYYVNDETSSANLPFLKTDCAAAADADIQFPDFEGINFQFNEDLGGFSWGGSDLLTIDGTTKYYRMTWLADWADHVTYMHEMGHGFGLPHSSGPYTNVYDSNWDVMSGSWTNHDSYWGWLAPHTISFHKNLLGWIPADRIYDATQGSTATITLHRLADLGAGGDYLMARVPRIDGTYYTVEARRFVGYDVNLPDSAVIMHHVHGGQAYVVDPDGNGNPDDEGARWDPGETFTDGESGVSITVDAITPEGFVVTIALQEPGHIVLDPDSIAFAMVQGTLPDPEYFAVRNLGIGDLQWSATVDAPWLDLDVTSGSLAANNSVGLTATVNGDLAPGAHEGTVTISGNADNSPQVLIVTVDVTAAPVLTLITEPLDIETVIAVDPPVHEVLVRNDGGVDLNWSASSDAPWMSFARGSGTLAPGASETDTVVISVDGLALGDYPGTLTFDGDAANAPQVLEVSLSVTDWPSIALAGTLAFEAYEGDSPAAGSMSLTNDGDGTLSWTAAADQPWVSLSPASGQVLSGSSTDIEVSVDGSSLPPGTHGAVVTVSGNADDSPQTVDVEFVVRARPDLAAQDIADHLMGVGTPLGTSDLEYLDATGNGNGSFDVGDFRAWLMREGLAGQLVRQDAGEEAP